MRLMCLPQFAFRACARSLPAERCQVPVKGQDREMIITIIMIISIIKMITTAAVSIISILTCRTLWHFSNRKTWKRSLRILSMTVGLVFKTFFDLFQMNLYFARPSFIVKVFTLSSWPNKNSSNKVCEKYSNGYLPRNTGSLDNVSEQLWGERAKRPRENWRIWFSLFSLFLPLSPSYSLSLSSLIVTQILSHFSLQTTLISFFNIFPSLCLSQWEKSPSI